MAVKKTVGVCYCGVAAEYQDEICNSLINYARNNGNIRLVYFTCFTESLTGSAQDIGEFRVFDLINWDKLDGMIILGQSIPDRDKIAEIANAAKAHNVPCVCLDWETDACPYIMYHCGDTVYKITDHLIKEHGCKKLNYVTAIKGDPVSDEREDGFMRALRDNGIEPEENRVAVGWWWTHAPREAVDKWLSEGMEIDAIVCANDVMAISVMRELSKKGKRVPEDIKVTGVDWLMEGQMITPQLTTADFDRNIDAAVAFEMLFGEIVGNVKLEPNLSFSESCGCPKAHKLNTNESIRKLNNFNDRLLIENRKNYELESKIIEQPDWQRALEMIQKDSSEQWVKKLWLCVNNDLIRTTIDDIDKPGFGYTTPDGYADTQMIIAHKNMEEMTYGDTFPTAELIPDFDNEIDYCGALLVFPLHVNDSSLGYCVREISEFSELEKWYLYSRSVSNALMIVRQENDLTLLNRMLEEMYNRDSMTRLYNRRGFFKNLSKLFEDPPGELFVIISIDLDGLKYINDNFGHLEGDSALIAIADFLSQLSGEKFVCARFGGDEFIAAGFAGEGEGAQFELDLQKKIDAYNAVSQKPYKISASTGRIEKPFSDDADFDNLVILADEAMYRSKTEKKSTLFRGRPRNS